MKSSPFDNGQNGKAKNLFNLWISHWNFMVCAIRSHCVSSMKNRFRFDRIDICVSHIRTTISTKIESRYWSRSFAHMAFRHQLKKAFVGGPKIESFSTFAIDLRWNTNGHFFIRLFDGLFSIMAFKLAIKMRALIQYDALAHISRFNFCLLSIDLHIVLRLAILFGRHECEQQTDVGQMNVRIHYIVDSLSSFRQNWFFVFWNDFSCLFFIFHERMFRRASIFRRFFFSPVSKQMFSKSDELKSNQTENSAQLPNILSLSVFDSVFQQFLFCNRFVTIPAKNRSHQMKCNRDLFDHFVSQTHGMKQNKNSQAKRKRITQTMNQMENGREEKMTGDDRIMSTCETMNCTLCI